LDNKGIIAYSLAVFYIFDCQAKKSLSDLREALDAENWMKSIEIITWAVIMLDAGDAM